MSAEVIPTVFLMLGGVIAVWWLGGCHRPPPATPGSSTPTVVAPLPPEVEYDPATAAQKYLERKKRP